MSPKLEEQIKKLQQAVSEIEARGAIFSVNAIEAALIPYRRKLGELEAQAGPGSTHSEY